MNIQTVPVTYLRTNLRKMHEGAHFLDQAYEITVAGQTRAYLVPMERYEAAYGKPELGLKIQELDVSRLRDETRTVLEDVFWRNIIYILTVAAHEAGVFVHPDKMPKIQTVATTKTET